MILPRYSFFTLSLLLAVLAQTAMAQGVSVSSSQPLDAAARASIRAQNQANWSSARAVNQAIVRSAKAAGNLSSVRTLIKGNVSSVMTVNKNARMAVQSSLRSSSSSTSSARKQVIRKSPRRGS